MTEESVQRMINAVREYVSRAVSPFSARLDEISLKIASLPTGQNGAPGVDGKEGPVGPEGKPGRDGAPGVDGKDGRDGDVGPVGKDGKQGPTGPMGPEGTPGKDGRDGRDGKDGREGTDGIDGASGRDALDIEILPSIEVSKSYPRGTFARHDGGIMRSFQQTIPGEVSEQFGWEVVMRGLAEIEISMPDDRLIAIKSRLTGMADHITAFQLPTMVYRGIYNADNEYQKGDVVTWGGSAWHCQVNDTKTAPREGADFHAWKLMVKEGRGGKDGSKGEKGDKGDPGRDGMDLTQMGFDGRKH